MNYLNKIKDWVGVGVSLVRDLLNELSEATARRLALGLCAYAKRGSRFNQPHDTFACIPFCQKKSRLTRFTYVLADLIQVPLKCSLGRDLGKLAKFSEPTFRCLEAGDGIFFETKFVTSHGGTVVDLITIMHA